MVNLDEDYTLTKKMVKARFFVEILERSPFEWANKIYCLSFAATNT